MKIQDFEEVKIAFQLMEGDNIANATGPYSLDNAIKNFNSGNYDLECSSVAIIYGLGGIHRYYLRPNGEIHFSKFHMGYKDVSKDAESLGFIVS